MWFFLNHFLQQVLGLSAIPSGVVLRPPEAGSLAAGILNTGYQVGSALGLTAMTAVAAGNGADLLRDVPR
jgi:hypothetical protein